MGEARSKVVRRPLELKARSGRRLEERLGVRFPRLVALLARIVWIQPWRGLRRTIMLHYIRLAWESFNRGDYEPTFIFYDPRAKASFPAEWGTIGVGTEVEGREERVRFQQMATQEWSELRFTPEEIVLWDEGVISVGRLIGTGRTSGAPLDTEWAAVLDMEKGRVVRERIFLDRREALATAGIPDAHLVS